MTHNTKRWLPDSLRACIVYHLSWLHPLVITVQLGPRLPLTKDAGLTLAQHQHLMHIHYCLHNSSLKVCMFGHINHLHHLNDRLFLVLNLTTWRFWFNSWPISKINSQIRHIMQTPEQLQLLPFGTFGLSIVNIVYIIHTCPKPAWLGPCLLITKDSN